MLLLIFGKFIFQQCVHKLIKYISRNRYDGEKLNMNNTCLQGTLQILEVYLLGSIEKWKKYFQNREHWMPWNAILSVKLAAISGAFCKPECNILPSASVNMWCKRYIAQVPLSLCSKNYGVWRLSGFYSAKRGQPWSAWPFFLTELSSHPQRTHRVK